MGGLSLGLKPLVVHLFVMYYACLSAITPPVCVAVFMASGLAKAKWIKVGGIACMIALPVLARRRPRTEAGSTAKPVDGQS